MNNLLNIKVLYNRCYSIDSLSLIIYVNLLIMRYLEILLKKQIILNFFFRNKIPNFAAVEVSLNLNCIKSRYE